MRLAMSAELINTREKNLKQYNNCYIHIMPTINLLTISVTTWVVHHLLPTNNEPMVAYKIYLMKLAKLLSIDVVV